jgi:hypothetical protein
MVRRRIKKGTEKQAVDNWQHQQKNEQYQQMDEIFQQTNDQISRWVRISADKWAISADD